MDDLARVVAGGLSAWCLLEAAWCLRAGLERAWSKRQARKAFRREEQ